MPSTPLPVAGAPGFGGEVTAPETGSEASTDPTLAATYHPEPGELKIKERRTWKTWQLVAAILVAALVGMWFNGSTGSASGPSASSGSGGGSYKLPAAQGTTSAGASNSAGGTTKTGAAGATTTKTGAAGATTTTTSAAAAAGSSSTTTSSVAVGPATVLIPATQSTGNWTSPAFTIAGGTWNIGWAYQCTPAPAAAPAFQIFAVNSGSAPGASPAVTSAAASGNSITPLTSTGSQQVIVQTSAACRWAVKVTGSGS